MGITLVLFDIDGTLLDVHGAGRQAFSRALEKMFGWQDDIAYIRFAGATDLDVLRQIMARRGRALAPNDETRFFEQLTVELEQTTSASPLTVFPGVVELLERLTADPRIMVGLVTGNVEACARIKLRRINLHGHFVLGAFGHEHADRREIARLALRRAEDQLGPGQWLASSFLIGDTPSDIAAAAAINARSIAVATGLFTASALAEAGADIVLDDLSDVDRVMSVLLSASA